MEREVGGGIGMGNTCKPMAVSFQCMTKSTTIKKKKMLTEKKKKKISTSVEYRTQFSNNIKLNYNLINFSQKHFIIQL